MHVSKKNHLFIYNSTANGRISLVTRSKYQTEKKKENACMDAYGKEKRREWTNHRGNIDECICQRSN